jgi:hypothetical protein
MIHVQDLGNRTFGLERPLLQYGDVLCVDVIELWFSGPTFAMKVFSAALYLVHPELDRAQGVGLLTELSISSWVNFVSVERFIC